MPAPRSWPCLQGARLRRTCKARLTEGVASGDIPEVSERLPSQPLVVDLALKGRSFGTHGGQLRTMVTRTKDVRQMVAIGYTRLVGYDEDYNLTPDILRDYEVFEGRKFTLHLRAGHKWSDGHPFTSADFEYWWRDVIGSEALTPSGPSSFLLVDGVPPEVRFPDALSVVFEWQSPNPEFLQTLAQARPPFIYRPAHYLKQFHASYSDVDDMEDMIDEKLGGFAQQTRQYV